jgi:uncharacterized protein YndB with AHSA1/START domain
MATNSTNQTIPDEGAVQEIDGRYVLRFERHFSHPVEKVWDALTRPERMVEWLGDAEIHVELVEGGRLSTRTTGPTELVEAIIQEAGEDALVNQDTVLRVEPPSLFEHTFGGDPGSIARWELQRDGDGCRLTLTHTEPPGFDGAHRPRDLAGWHVLLEQLGEALDGKHHTWRKERWEELRDHYKTKTRDVRFEYVTYIEATPEKVWHALTDADLSGEYWGHSNVSDWQVGSRWEHQRTDGTQIADVVGTVLESVPPVRLAATWSAPDETRSDGPTRVSFDIEPSDAIVRLTVTHENLADEAERIASAAGWSAVMSNLKSILEMGHTLPQAPWEMPR